MFKKTALALVVTSVFAVSSAIAAPTSEFSASGYFDSTKMSPGSSKTDSINANVAYGYYFLPRLVGKVGVFMNSSETTGSSKTLTQAVGVGAKYYLGEAEKSAWVPYVFADLLSTSSQSSGTTMNGMGIDVGAGVSNFLTETVSFDIEAKVSSSKYTVSGSDVTIDGTKLAFGFTARF